MNSFTSLRFLVYNKVEVISSLTDVNIKGCDICENRKIKRQPNPLYTDQR